MVCKFNENACRNTEKYSRNTDWYEHENHSYQSILMDQIFEIEQIIYKTIKVKATLKCSESV